MAALVIIGAQWGDEGKGKIVDLIGEQAHWIVRFQGGNNAGHTIVADGRKAVLHLLPSGIFHPHTQVVLGNGVVVDPLALLEEVERLEGLGVSVWDRLHLSERAQLVMPYHHLLDRLSESDAQNRYKLGTTGRGIGPSYADKAARLGFRFIDFAPRHRQTCLARLESVIAQKNIVLAAASLSPAENAALDAATIYAQYRASCDRLAGCVKNTSLCIERALDAGERVLFEGAQGVLLDVDHGTYPFVTSSHTVAGGVCSGVGIGPTRIDRVLGVTKAYATRVGEGPMPTELHDDDGERLQRVGEEFGATTGRVRRCGWLDAVALRDAIRTGGINALAVTKLDVLDAFPQVKIAVAYEDPEGERHDTLPAAAEHLATMKPVYETLPGWEEDTSTVTEASALPLALRAYLERIAALCKVPVQIISTGPERRQTIIHGSAFP